MSVRRFEFTYPVKEEPEWKNLVARWYQLDAAAYGLAQGYWHWRHELERMGQPDFLLLAGMGGSNAADREFVLAGAASPQKFAHTLPNVRSSSLCQVMKWAGPMLCLGGGSRTMLASLTEAQGLLGQGFSRVWVMGVFAGVSGNPNLTAFLGIVSREPQPQSPGARVFDPFSIASISDRFPNGFTDTDFQAWLNLNAYY